MALIPIAVTLLILLSTNLCASMDGDIGTSLALFGSVMASVLHALAQMAEKPSLLQMDQKL